jgi:TatD DNase family protein
VLTFVDTHCHLDFNFFDDDREAVISRAKAAGIECILNPGVDLASSRAALNLAETNAEIFAGCGVHPNDSLSWDDLSRNELRKLANHPKVVAIGEIGLDYYRDRAPIDLQKRVFLEQLALAGECELPVIIHNRQASSDVLDILSAWHKDLVSSRSSLAERPGVLHSFSGDQEIVRKALEINFFIGVSGPITYRNAQELRQTINTVPLEALLIETDAPFLTPHPYRGQRNEPAHVRWVLDKIAELYNLPVGVVAEATTKNSQKLFKW